MAEFKKICCGVDFSDLSTLAMAEAADLSRRFEAELTLVHVYEPPPDAASGSTAHARLPRTLDEAWQRLDKCRRQAEFLAERPVKTKILEGDPSGEFVRFAREHGVDLVVVGTRGRTGLTRVVLGSVAEQVVRHAPCPVLVMRRWASVRPLVADLIDEETWSSLDAETKGDADEGLPEEDAQGTKSGADP